MGDDDPITVEISNLKERTARLEERFAALEGRLTGLEKRLEKLDGRTWAILATILVNIGIAILLKMI